MFCPKCGTKAVEGAGFCQKCGAKLIVDVPVERPAETPRTSPVQQTTTAPANISVKKNVVIPFAQPSGSGLQTGKAVPLRLHRNHVG